jgi:Cupin-like domain
MFDCFSNDFSAQKLDREAFKFQHKLMGHPALTLENLARVIPALPKKHVMYSKGLLDMGADFETTFRARPKNQTIEETIENIRVKDSYIMVSSPEVDKSFAPVYAELLNDVNRLIKMRGVGSSAISPKLYLFIASPNSVTPFHLDRYSTFLMQFRGSKQISVFPQWDEQVVSAMSREAYVAYADTHLPWAQEKNQHATQFQFKPGDALHIPFVAGHHVKNGAEDVSISMSIIFNTAQTTAWRKALLFNHAARKPLARIGMTPSPVGRSAARDHAKARLLPVAQRAMKFMKRQINAESTQPSTLGSQGPSTVS